MIDLNLTICVCVVVASWMVEAHVCTWFVFERGSKRVWGWMPVLQSWVALMDASFQSHRNAVFAVLLNFMFEHCHGLMNVCSFFVCFCLLFVHEPQTQELLELGRSPWHRTSQRLCSVNVSLHVHVVFVKLLNWNARCVRLSAAADRFTRCGGKWTHGSWCSRRFKVYISNRYLGFVLELHIFSHHAWRISVVFITVCMSPLICCISHKCICCKWHS